MMNRGQLESLLDELYWHEEHGETKKAVDKLMALQTETLDAAVRAIMPDNPLAKSAYAEGRNAACREILKLKDGLQ